MDSRRPSERAAQSVIDRENEEKKSIKNGLKKAVNFGLGVAGGGLASRVLPFLSEHIPADLAVKGISAISPKLGAFLKKGMESGLDINEGKQFVKDKIDKSNNPKLSPSGFPIPEKTQEQPKQEKQQPQDNRNIIEQYSPELHEFIKAEVTKGRKPQEAAALAQLGTGNKKFQSVIKQMEKDHKIPWSTIVQNIYGGQQQNESLKNDAMNPPGSTPIQSPSAEQQAFSQQSKQVGQGQQALQQFMNDARKLLGS